MGEGARGNEKVKGRQENLQQTLQQNDGPKISPEQAVGEVGS